jgi:hypothetical protein
LGIDPDVKDFRPEAPIGRLMERVLCIIELSVLVCPTEFEPWSHGAEAVQAIKLTVDVKVLEGINHMGIVTNPKAVSAIAEDVATHGSGQS